jgi:hypothetical protein
MFIEVPEKLAAFIFRLEVRQVAKSDVTKTQVTNLHEVISYDLVVTTFTAANTRNRNT